MWITTKLLWILYTFYNVWFAIKWRFYNVYEPLDYFIFIAGYLLIYLYSEGINFCVKSKFKRVLSSSLLIFLYFLAGKYHYRVKANFDYIVFIDNFFELFNEESVGIIFSTFKKKDLYQSLSLIPIIFILGYKTSLFESKIIDRKKSSVLILLYGIILFFMPFPHGELSYVIKSGLDFHFGGFETGKEYKELSNKKEPYRRVFESNYEESKPDIYMVVLESYSGIYLNEKIDGKYVTPTLNSLLKEGVSVEDFYGNSVQTIKGQFSIYCSKIPLIRGKASYKVTRNNLDCLPEKLKKLGYENLFFQSYTNLDFDNTGKFMRQIGFKNLAVSDSSLLNIVQRKENIWGWGMQDDLSYKQFINKSLEYKKADEPLFAVMHTISHHMKFNRVPNNQRYFYPNSKNKKQDFINSLHLSDKYLGEFIKEMKAKGLYDNSIIIITGDHSYPAGEHGLYDNQTSYYQEFFKTPFLVIWKDKLEPQIIKKETRSQIDIAPTLLDLIGYSGNIEYLGNSIFSGEKSYAYLVQPYNGTFLSVVNYPYKYVWNKRNGKEFLYNIEVDPSEESPIDDSLHTQIRNTLRGKVDQIIFNNDYVTN